MLEAEAWSTIFVRSGIALMIGAAVLGVVAALLLRSAKKRLEMRLEKEFGPKRH